MPQQFAMVVDRAGRMLAEARWPRATLVNCYAGAASLAVNW